MKPQTATHLTAAQKDAASWLINAGQDDTQRLLADMTGTPDDIRILQAAIAAESASATPRSSRLKPMEAKLRKFSAAATANTLAIIRDRQSGLVAAPAETEVVPPAKALLSDAASALEKLRGVIVKHEDKFASATLGPRLQMGLQCLRAYQVFVIPDPKKRGAMKGKKLLTREELYDGGFKGWLSAEAEWLKEPTAYKYMTAVRGLGLDHTATEKQVAAALKLLIRKGPVTITSLCAAALEAIGPPAPPPPNLQQSEFEFLKQGLTSFRAETEHLLNMKDKLKENPDFHRAATARLYAALVELTGTNWAPSDEPDDLANVDPDAISI